MKETELDPALVRVIADCFRHGESVAEIRQRCARRFAAMDPGLVEQTLEHAQSAARTRAA